MKTTMTKRDARPLLETRSVKGLTVREAAKDSGYIGTLVGHAAVFDSDSLEFSGWEKPWVERIAPGAFKRTLVEMPDVRALYQHDSAEVLGRAPNTLRLSEDKRGLAIEIQLVDTQLNRDTLTNVRAGNLDAMSFGFVPRSVKWDDGEKRDVRTLLDVDLHEVSVVTWPAYPASSVGARGLSPEVAELEALRKEREAFFKAARASEQPSNHLLRFWERRVRLL